MTKPGRNDPCICGSGKKFKKCCESKYNHKTIQAQPMVEGSPGVNKIGSLFQKNITSGSQKKHQDDFNPVM